MTAKRFRKKPITIEAFRIGIDEPPSWAQDADHFRIIHANDDLVYAEIETLEGIMRGYYGDYVIRGAIGELYPCRADIFEDTYSPELYENEESIYKNVLQRIYRLVATSDNENLVKLINRIYAWGSLKADPELSLEEIKVKSEQALSNLLN